MIIFSKIRLLVVILTFFISTGIALANNGTGDENKTSLPEGLLAIFATPLKYLVEYINNNNRNTTYALAEVYGPDADDQKFDEDHDREFGLEYSLYAEAKANKPNNKDDGVENPYSPGEDHSAEIIVHWLEGDNDSWGANFFSGRAKASPDDDPEAEDIKTSANVVGFFLNERQVPRGCYEATAEEGHDSKVRALEPKDPKCKELLQHENLSTETKRKSFSNSLEEPFTLVSLEQAIIFFADVNRFVFEEVEGGKVLIRPLFGPIIDIFHTYMQKEDNLLIFPVLRGYDEISQELRMNVYENEETDTLWKISSEASEQADLTIAGAALQFSELLVNRNNKTNSELLKDYLSSEAVIVIPPKHAQQGYEPKVSFRYQIDSNDDIKKFIGKNFTILSNMTEGTLNGLIIGITGDMNEAVTLALNTEEHFIRELATKTLNDSDISDSTDNKVRFVTPELSFRHEGSINLSDIASNSPSPKYEFRLMVKLDSFEIHKDNKENISINWNTATETENVGMNLWCAQMQDNQFQEITQLNNQLIPSRAILPNHGASYSSTDYPYVNTNLQPGVQHCTLEDIDASGQCTLHCDHIDTVVIGEDKLSDTELNEFQAKAIALCNEHKLDGVCLD